MRRRTLLALIGAAATSPLAARAQQRSVPVIGFLSSRSPGEAAYIVGPFRDGLKEAGYIDGRNVAIEFRWAEEHNDRLPALAADLVRRQVSVIVAGGTSRWAKAATTTIPIVFTTGQDPLLFNLVANLGRPEGNVTGVTMYSGALGAKQLELLSEIVPKATSIACLVNPSNPAATPQASAAQAAARAIRREIHVLNASSERELEQAYATAAKARVGGLLVTVDPFFDSRPRRLVELAARNAVPSIYYLREFVVSGGLISYGARIADMYRQAGVYAGRILKGAKPSELPVVLPTKYELVVNLRAAKALGLGIPQSLLLQADDVIQ